MSTTNDICLIELGLQCTNRVSQDSLKTDRSVFTPVLQECRSAGMVVLQTTVARNGGPRTYNTRNVGPTRPPFLVTLVRDGHTELKMKPAFPEHLTSIRSIWNARSPVLPCLAAV